VLLLTDVFASLSLPRALSFAAFFAADHRI
jgi:hypothetical protein